jgi:acyl dehydratase
MSETDSIKVGWRGRFFEDFQIGDIYRSPFGRTVTELDNSLFTHLTMNSNPLHFDAEYTARTRWGRILVNSTFTLGLVTGMTVGDVSQNAVANLGWEKVTLPHPVFVGDTLYSETIVLGKRESKSHSDAGIVAVRTRGINQAGDVVIEFERSILVYKRLHAPTGAIFPSTPSR